MAVTNKKYIIEKCESLIKSFNPVTHSIDTHCAQHLGDVAAKDSKPENVFIQQVVYGWYRERAVLEAFIRNFYADNASKLLRSDMLLYTIFAYLAIFRLEELGFHKFKEFTMTQDPTKVYNFATYLFNKENLWNCLRADWMKVRDLQFVEDELIASVEQFLPELNKFCGELEDKAVGLAAAQAMKEEQQKAGKVGLQEIAKSATTVPISPRLSKPRPRPLPIPEKISTKIEANEVPEYINRTNLEEINRQKAETTVKNKEQTLAQYDDKFHFQFHETKGGKSIDEIRAEMEQKEVANLAFDSSFVNLPPDFSKIPAKIRGNIASVLREDYLYRKQQAKDVQILRNYEEELRDPVEYFAWQNKLKERDDLIKIQHVADRRLQAKLSAEEAKEATNKQREDNHAVADIQREQAEIVLRRRQLEQEIEFIENKEVVKLTNEMHEARIKEVQDRLKKERENRGQSLRDELERARLAKEEEDKQEELRRADKIRQLRALDLVQKKHIVVFDPTETAGVGVLDEMSYMEMKERLASEKKRMEELEEIKRVEIIESKERRAKELESRALSIARARQVKQDSQKAQLERKKLQEQREAEAKERAREEAAIKLDQAFHLKREMKRAEAAALKAEEDRTKRKQQYMGVAAGLVDATRAEQLLEGLERETLTSQFKAKEAVVLQEQSLQSDKMNRQHFKKQHEIAKVKVDREKDALAEVEKNISIAKVKANVLRKKEMVGEGRLQHQLTKTVVVENNPYAASISTEIHEMTMQTKNRRQQLASIV